MFATKSSKPFSFFSINGPTKFFQDKKKTNKNYIRGKQSCIYKYFSIFVNLSSSNHEEKKLQQKKYRAKETCRHRYITVKRCCCSLANTKKKTKSKRPLRFDFEIVWKRPNQCGLTFRMHFDGATCAISAIFSFIILSSMFFNCILNENIFYFENNCFEIISSSKVIHLN